MAKPESQPQTAARIDSYDEAYQRANRLFKECQTAMSEAQERAEEVEEQIEQMEESIQQLQGSLQQCQLSLDNFQRQYPHVEFQCDEIKTDHGHRLIAVRAFEGELKDAERIRDNFETELERLEEKIAGLDERCDEALEQMKCALELKPWPSKSDEH